MIALFIFLGYLLCGVLFTIVAGRTTQAFDYTPKYGEVKPTTAKYTTTLLWPFILLFWIMAGIWDLTGWFFKAIDRGFNRLAGVDKRR